MGSVAFTGLAAMVAALIAVPVDALAGGPATGPELFTNTLYVEDLIIHDGSLYAATRGGVERYHLTTLQREVVLTTQHGLPSNTVRKLERRDGSLWARTHRASCRLAGRRFVCVAAAPFPAPQPQVARLLEGARVTCAITVGQRELVGTAGRGVWLGGAAPRRLTPRGQICSNHVMAVTRYRKRVWLGTFDQGLCTFDGRRFRTVPAPFRMVNDLQATPSGLFVAAAAGLFQTRDGRRFERVDYVAQRGVNGLAYDARKRVLYATTPGALWRMSLRRARWRRQLWTPAGSTALQGVEVAGDSVWLASEDRGAIRYRGGRFEPFDRVAGLPTSWGLDVAVGADGNAYLATLRHGLVRIGAQGQAERLAGLPSPWLLHVSAAGGDLLVGTQGGAVLINPAGEVRRVGDLPNPCVHVLEPVGADLWVGTEGGTVRVPGAF